MEKDEYKCYVCEQVFKKGLTDAEAEEQLTEEFGEGFITEDCDLVCDDCYKKMFRGDDGIQTS